MDINNMEFNNILLNNIETPINITFSTPSQIFSNSTEKYYSKNGQHDDSHVLKIEKHIKDKYDEVALNYLRQKIMEEFTKLSKIPKIPPDHAKLSLMKLHIDSLESEIYSLREKIRQKNLLIISLISLRSTINETPPDNKDYENKVCINPQPLIENRIPNIVDITDNETSTNRNISTKISNQKQKSFTEKSKELTFIICDSMIKDLHRYLLTGSLNRKYIVKVRPFSSAKTSDMEYYITPTKRYFDPGIYILHDCTLDDTPKEITEHIANIATLLKPENNTVVISNIVPRGNSKKKRQKLTNYRSTSANKKKYSIYKQTDLGHFFVGLKEI